MFDTYSRWPHDHDIDQYFEAWHEDDNAYNRTREIAKRLDSTVQMSLLVQLEINVIKDPPHLRSWPFRP